MKAIDDTLIQPAVFNPALENFDLRPPEIEDAADVQRLIQESPPLDVNSTYAYLLLCRHFRDTCVVATRQGQLAGFVSAYLPPKQSNVLFVWQVAVHPMARGRRLGQRMLEHLLARPLPQPIHSIETTVSPSNQPSRRMFAALAQDRGAQCVEQPMFPPELFGQAEHEDERLLRIGPF
ncbi:diaminobutyrate acetyltransferase [Pigmentiphaga sp. NML030171]|uniref:diaminobutyrate acetyltransferase n=1 Tax=Pigmentiphaga sp. NML030171 TaxID=2008676 RepID=UPI000B41939F|nr:diaminobutyrate acetyltransferase [Pigmentiphaga sp. NML030171]